MHYHCEIILPPQFKNVKKAVEQVLAPFSESQEENRDTFWDWYQIGGRYAGSHVTSRYDPELLKRFNEELRSREVTVSGLVWGKEELSPPEQIPMVDALWAEMFPSSGLKHCPLFFHSNKNHDDVDGDICRVSELGQWQRAYRVIIAGPAYSAKAGKHTFDAADAVHMIEQSIWNGVTHVDTKFDGNVLAEIERFNSGSDRYAADYAKLVRVTPDHIAVTVDYHS